MPQLPLQAVIHRTNKLFKSQPSSLKLLFLCNESHESLGYLVATLCIICAQRMGQYKTKLKCGTRPANLSHPLTPPNLQFHLCLTLMQVKLINVIPYCTMTMTNQKHPPLNATVKNDKRLSNNEQEEQRRKLLITLEEGVWSWHRPCPQSTTHPIKFDSPNHGRLCLSPA